MYKSNSSFQPKTKHLMSISYAIISSLIFSLILTLLVGKLVGKKIIENNLSAVVNLVRVITGFLSCTVGIKLIKENALLNVSLISAGNILIMMALGILFFDGTFSGVGWGIVSVLIGALLALFLNKFHKSNKITVKKYKR